MALLTEQALTDQVLSDISLLTRVLHFLFVNVRPY